MRGAGIEVGRLLIPVNLAGISPSSGNRQMQITNKTAWRRGSYALPLVHRQGRSRGSYAHSLAILLIGPGLFAHVLPQAVVEAAVPAWRAAGGHEAYRNNNLEEHFGNEHRMLLSFLKSRRKTDNGSQRTVTQNRCTAGANAPADKQARAAQDPSRNSTAVTADAESTLAPAKFCDGNNSKLGKGLMSFDMTPGVSCPGSTHAICRELRPDGNADPKPICWACRKKYRQQKMKDRLAVNLRFSRTDSFVEWANGVISRRRTAKAVRLPGTGDMYSAKFVSKVRSIVQANPKMRFWAYTRSWVIPSIWEELQKFGDEPNMVLWLSWDRAMARHYGPPPDRKFPWCWLATDDDDLPVEPVEIVWRYDGHLQWNQSLPEKHILGSSLVCPHEDGVTNTTCLKCGLCWRDAKFRQAKISKLLDKYKD